MCEECDEAIVMMDNCWSVKVGNEEIGYGDVDIYGCEVHVKWIRKAIERHLHDERYLSD